MVADTREQGDPRSARRLNEPQSVHVATADRVPAEVDRALVELVRDEWRVVDRWWTEEPVRRRYFEVVLECGRNVVVFEDQLSGRWFRQRP
jgi:hypothetical protein